MNTWEAKRRIESIEDTNLRELFSFIVEKIDEVENRITDISKKVSQ